MAALPGTPAGAAAFGAALRSWRLRKRCSQLELALAAGVSQRHLSYLETGRARPGPATVLRLAEALDLPLGAVDELLLAAGYAPRSPSRRAGAASAAFVSEAVELVLRGAEPNPAAAVDPAWNVLAANRPFAALARRLLPRQPGLGPLNLLRAFFDPAGLRPHIVNWTEIAAANWQRARADAAAAFETGPGDVLAEIERCGWLPPAVAAAGPPVVPVLPVVLRVEGRELSFVTVVSTFGTPQDALLERVRFETFYPANRATAAALAGLGAE
jgi:transcriptional regulator with XRE-family HTH domain